MRKIETVNKYRVLMKAVEAVLGSLESNKKSLSALFQDVCDK